MKITIGVSSWFKRYTGGLSSLEQELHEGESAWEAVVRAGIPMDEIGFITVSAERQQPDVEKKVDDSYVVAGGDALKVYPMIIGG